MNSQIQFWASGNNYQKRNSNSGKCKRGHVLLFTSHQIFREKFPIQGYGSTFFGKCTLTHSYETKAVLLQQHIQQSWYHTRIGGLSVEFRQEQLSKKKITNLFQFCFGSMITKKINLLTVAFVYLFFICHEVRYSKDWIFPIFSGTK